MPIEDTKEDSSTFPTVAKVTRSGGEGVSLIYFIAETFLLLLLPLRTISAALPSFLRRGLDLTSFPQTPVVRVLPRWISYSPSECSLRGFALSERFSWCQTTLP